MLVVRSGTLADHPVYVRLVPELHIQDPVKTVDEFASRMLPRMVIGEDEGHAVGYACWRVYSTTAHVVHLVVDPAARGRRVGRAIMEDVRLRVRAEGATRWFLNVIQDNAPARRLYERCGMSTEFEAWASWSSWSALETLPKAPDAVVAFVPSPEEDRAIATTLGLEPERVGLFRERSAPRFAALRESEQVVGFAIHDPEFPSIHPLRVKRPELVQALVDALKPHAKEDRVMVVVEGDESLYESLCSVGAKLFHAIYRMSGDVG